MATPIVFVHGWSVTHTNTYGKLPERLVAEAKLTGVDLSVKDVYLGRYVSFHDEVTVKDIARAFRQAVIDEKLDVGGRFVCVTHSTGGPVVREWWRRYHQNAGDPTCPMSHLIMLAPANYGSALAVLGKGRLSRLSSWWSGVEPGQRVLDWLALGSDEAWQLNTEWMRTGDKHIGPNGVFPFVLTGQSIDRKLYDNLNSYTGELGSDGVVRVAAANLEGRCVRLVQQAPKLVKDSRGRVDVEAPLLELDKTAKLEAPPTPLRVLEGKSHSGTTKGVMASVKAAVGTKADQATVDSILRCIAVKSAASYRTVIDDFAAESQAVMDAERLEVERRFLVDDRYFIHDQYSMVVFRVTDHEGFPVNDYDLLLTAGQEDDPNHLPQGFFVDRQQNPNRRNTITYFINHSVMVGCPEVRDGTKVVRPELPGTTALGFRLVARPDEGFARYRPCGLKASTTVLKEVVRPNATTLVDIVLRRVVGKETFRLDRTVDPMDFKNVKPGEPLKD